MTDPTPTEVVPEPAAAVADPVVDAESLYELHIDPFPLKSDACAKCGQQPMASRMPCLDCFGETAYCSEECMWDNYCDHRQTCIATQCRAIRATKPLPELRTKQIKGASFQKLLRHVVQNVDRKTLLENIMFIRLPDNPAAKFAKDHPVKRVPREGAAAIMVKNVCLRETARRWLRHVAGARGVSPYLYFFAYPLDYSFCFMMAVPYEEQEKFDEALTPTTDFVICPCATHSGSGPSGDPGPQGAPAPTQ